MGFQDPSSDHSSANTKARISIKLISKSQMEPVEAKKKKIVVMLFVYKCKHEWEINCNFQHKGTKVSYIYVKVETCYTAI